MSEETQAIVDEANMLVEHINRFVDKVRHFADAPGLVESLCGTAERITVFLLPLAGTNASSSDNAETLRGFVYKDSIHLMIDFVVETEGELLAVSIRCASTGDWSIWQSGDLRDDIRSLDQAREEWGDVYMTLADFKADRSVLFADVLAALLHEAGLPGDWSGGGDEGEDDEGAEGEGETEVGPAVPKGSPPPQAIAFGVPAPQPATLTNRRSGADVVNDAKLEAFAAAGASRLLASLSPVNAEVELLDFNEPPPGYRVVESPARTLYPVTPGGGLFTGQGCHSAAVAAAWAHREQSNPPGMEVIVHPDGGLFAVLVEAAGHHLVLDARGHAYEARAAAWAWYKPRAAVTLRLVEDDGRCLSDLWPRALTWSDDQMHEVQCWLDSPLTEGVEMPEVLRG